MTIEMKAATFYLNCYLSPFTEKYPELSHSVQNMSLRRHGGLIVIQRQDALENLIQPGIHIGADLTHSLLESIFFPGNPLHDGAVLVHQNQIESVANVLPLSERYTGEKKLGTRHRAALGLSEQSDALVMVVSEETGRISLLLRAIYILLQHLASYRGLPMLKKYLEFEIFFLRKYHLRGKVITEGRVKS